MTEEQVLQEATVSGNIIQITKESLDRDVYLNVKKKLEMIGGRWKGGKTWGFVFSEDPTNLLKDLQEGKDRNLQKEFQYFPTTGGALIAMKDFIKDYLVNKDQERLKILEPSAGQGHLIELIRDLWPKAQIDYCELMDLNKNELDRKYKNMPNIACITEDFTHMAGDPEEHYDFIIANPPFTNNQDIQHIRLMYELLVSGGEIFTFCSFHWQMSTNKKEENFKKFLDNLDEYPDITEVPEKAFKNSGTNIRTMLMHITKA
jgi:hypothetical protein